MTRIALNCTACIARMDGWMTGWMDRKTVGQIERKKDRRTDSVSILVISDDVTQEE